MISLFYINVYDICSFIYVYLSLVFPLLMLLPIFILYCFWLLPRLGEWKLPAEVFNRMELFILFVRNLLAAVFQFHLAMLSRFRNAIFNVVGGLEPLPVLKDSDSSDDRTFAPKFPYSRPHFLQFHTDEEILVSADHHIRPIIVPRDISKLPWNSGYAE